MRKSISFLICTVVWFVSINVWAQKPKQAFTYEKATFGAGCFWCIEPPYDKTKGVIKTEVGYSGGRSADASYKKVSQGTTGHLEVIQVTFDPKVISYAEIVDIFWKNVDPFNGDGQFCDKGPQYRSAIFYHNKAQENIARQSKKKLEQDPRYKKFGKVQTDMLPFDAFYLGEEYHQDYYVKNPTRYKFYRYSCGRDKRLKEIWGTEKPAA
ncbi:MAG: peptide-methionine (S)-S-oxide reductase MsrA [Deltaproteobacteria bacterium]|nr:peptide-methionine (S)-S-oxide reductase MsrA [Deltaproteobacteria bacterium]